MFFKETKTQKENVRIKACYVIHQEETKIVINHIKILSIVSRQ